MKNYQDFVLDKNIFFFKYITYIFLFKTEKCDCYAVNICVSVFIFLCIFLLNYPFMILIM